MWYLFLLNCLCLGVNTEVLPLYELSTEDGILFVSAESTRGVNSTILLQSRGDGVFATGLFSAFTMITISEVGDRTFFIALVLSLAHPPMRVLCGALSALSLMTVLSACLGLFFSFLSSLWIHYLSTFLFLVFGLKLIRDGCFMSSNAGKEEFEDVQKTLEKKMMEKNRGNLDVEDGHSPKSSLGVRVVVEAFTMTFVSEWGDRSQLATVVLAAKHDVFSVVMGAILGHALCTLAAVTGGRLIADRISVRTVTIIGGVLFLAFAVGSFIGALEETFEESII